ncbi:MAG: hypothetical protein ING09_07315 [Roseomonas sp.]|nr:hypothetical protein [Roseomonas sp.]MCA3292398.1 hypothetical protein [Roseomonas sp.]MCA3296311.1 hypothetical protein [Roseomonas sp.]MCA3343141.1 hypothetical protein [Roseomonas sp.]
MAGILSAIAFIALSPVPDFRSQVTTAPAASTQIDATYVSPISAPVRSMLAERIAEAAVAQEAAERAKAEAATALEQARQARAELAQSQSRSPPPPPTPTPAAASPASPANTGVGLVAPNPSIPSSTPPVGGVEADRLYVITNGVNGAAGELKAAGRSIPLPTGPFERLAVGQETLGGTRQYSAAFAQFNGKMLVAIVVVNLTPRAERIGTGLRGYTPCARRDLHFIEVAANEDFGRQECRYINHIWPNPWDGQESSALLRSVATALKARDSQLPGALIQSTFHFADKDELLRVFYYFNPEVKGIASARTASWAESDWHKSYLARDARRIDYLGELQKWTNDWAQYIRPAFTGGSPSVPPPRLARQFVTR